MAFDGLCGVVLFWVLWATFSPKSFGKQIRVWRDEIAEGWNSPPEEKI